MTAPAHRITPRLFLAWTMCLAALNTVSLPAAETTIVPILDNGKHFIQVELPEPRTPQSVKPPPKWLQAWPLDGTTNSFRISHRLMLQLERPEDLEPLLERHNLTRDRTLNPTTFIVEAADAVAGLGVLEALAHHPGVIRCRPVMRRPMHRDGPYAPLPNDPFFGPGAATSGQWHLENRNESGQRRGIDLNIRAAWPLSRGEGVNIAIVDDGMDLQHPEFANNSLPPIHFDFTTSLTNGNHASSFFSHGTAVAGLAVAEGANSVGITGTAPASSFASWVIFGSNPSIASDESLMDMFQYQTNLVQVQNHSWGNASVSPLAPTSLERIALTNAFRDGRNGLGTLMIRSGGNGRENQHNANDDGYSNDPNTISVAAVRDDGRITSYSNPGACILVAAPSGDNDSPNLFTTDRLGSLGFNKSTNPADLPDYAHDNTGFSGTSASAPLISGVCALVISARPDLSIRDVQQILIHSSRHFDRTDPDLRLNGAGYEISHNQGFGIPDAGAAVRLALDWPNRPPFTTVTFTNTDIRALPDDGLQLILEGDDIPPELQIITAFPSEGPHPDDPTAPLPLTELGQAIEPIEENLTGKGALIQRGETFFWEKIENATQAGAAFAVIYNNRDGDAKLIMSGTAFTTIPSIFISQNDGEALRDLLGTNTTVTARIELDKVTTQFTVPDTLLCEHVGLRVKTSHDRRGDVRITLVSPSGTRSVLQHVTFDSAPGPVDWTYWSLLHHYEPSAGVWTVEITDEQPLNTGSIQSLELIVRGVPLADSDNDGLEDGWETQHFGALAETAAGDFDQDGFHNLREFITGTDPTAHEILLRQDIAVLKPGQIRLSWPTVPGVTYELKEQENVIAPASVATNLPATSHELEFVIPSTGFEERFFRIQEVVPGK